MLRFFGYVPLCPDGYFWDDKSRGRFKDDDERLAKHFVLRPKSKDSPSYFNAFEVEPALFKIFSALESTPQAILAFANQHGMVTDCTDDYRLGGTSLKGWRRQIARFREQTAIGEKLMARPAAGSGRRKQAEDVAQFLNGLIGGISISLQVESLSGLVDLRANVFELMDVITIQLAEAVAERKTYRTCDHCGKPFELTPQVNRSDRLFCSDNCRVKSYQRRRKQAIVMRAEGKALRQIAKTCLSDLPTVKKWVGEAKQEE